MSFETGGRVQFGTMKGEAELEIVFVEGSLDLLDKVEPLWSKLNKHHQTISTHFGDRIAEMTYEQRKLHWASSELLRVDIAVDKELDEPIGYCVTIISDDLGEIESIFVNQSYRRTCMGHTLMERALEWLKNNHATRIRVNVAVGNEQVFDFYKKYGFNPRAIILEQLVQ